MKMLPLSSALFSVPSANISFSFTNVGNGVYDVPLVSLSSRLRSYSSSNDSSKRQATSPGARPVYVDSNGRWWDETYTLCRNAPIVPSSSPPTRAEGSELSVQDPQLLAFIQSNPKPHPNAFSTYTDYEAALIKWKDTLEEAIHRSEIVLPTPQGRFYYRPAFNPQSASLPTLTMLRSYIQRLGTLLTLNLCLSTFSSYLQRSSILVRSHPNPYAASSSSTSLNTPPTDPFNHLQSESELLPATQSAPALALSPTQNRTPSTPELARATSSSSPRIDRLKGLAVSPEISVSHPRRDEKEAPKKASARDPWDAQLIPSEPNPQDFDTFEAFENAMRRWAFLVSQTDVIPMHAHQLPIVIPLAMPALQQQVKTSDQIVGMELTAPRRPGLPQVNFWDPLEISPFRPAKLNALEPRPFLPDLDIDDEDVSDWVDILGSASSTDVSHLIPLGAHGIASALPDLGNDFSLDSYSASESFKLRVSVGTASESQSAPNSPLSHTAAIAHEEVITDFRHALDAIHQRALKNHEKYPPHHTTPVHGQIHGTFPKPNWAGHRTGMLALRTDALRRTDLSPLQIESSHGCGAVVDGRNVEFHSPAFDLAGINYRELVENSSYRQEVSQRALQLQYHTRHYQCYSWYRKTPSAQVQVESSKLYNLANNRGKDATIEELAEILLGPMDLDVFQDILDEDIELSNGQTRSIGSVLAQSINVKQFPSLLELFERSKEPLAHSKLSAFVTTVLQFNKAHELIQFLVSNGRLEHAEENAKFAHLNSGASDILSSPRLFMGTLRSKSALNGLRYLPLLCYALNYFKPVKTDIYPYSHELVALAAGVIGVEYRPIIELIFVYYYVKTIQSVLQSQSIQFGTTAPMVNRTLNMVSQSLLGQLVAYPAFLGSMITSIAYRSVKVSSLFTFLTLQLLRCDSFAVRNDSPASSMNGSSTTPRRITKKNSSDSLSAGQYSLQPALEVAEEIKAILAAPSVDLLGYTLKTLASSRFSHARHACQRIVDVLRSPSWLDTSLAMFEASMNLPVGPFHDFIQPSSDISPHYLEALSSILTAAIDRVISSADHLVLHPSHATVLVSAPIVSVMRPAFRSAFPPQSMSNSTMSTFTHTQASGATSSSSSSSSANTSPAMANPGLTHTISTSSIAGSSSTPRATGAVSKSSTGPVSMLRLPSTNSVSNGGSSSLPSSPSTLPQLASPTGTSERKDQISYADLVAHNTAAISFLLSNRALYGLLKICGDTLIEVDFRTRLASSILGKIAKAITRCRSIQLAPSLFASTASTLSSSTSSSRRVTTLSVQQPHILDTVPLLCYIRDHSQFSQSDRVIRIGLHELKGICEFLSMASGSVPRLVHEAKRGLLICLRHFLKSATIFEAVKQENEFHSTLASLCRSPPYATNTEAWRCLYQMVKFHPGTVDYLVKNKFLHLYFEGLGSYGSSDKLQGLIMTQNALKYTTKLFSLNSDTASLSKQKSAGALPPLSPNGSSSSIGSSSSSSSTERTTSSGSLNAANSNPSLASLVAPLSPKHSSQHPDAKALSQFIINSHVFIKFHVIYKKLSELDAGAAYAELISFYYALLTHPNCKKLLKATSKNDSFREGISYVGSLQPLIKEMLKQDKIWSAARAAITKERIRSFKLREKDDASSLGSPRRGKDKEKDKRDKDAEKREKEADKDKEKKKKKADKDKKRKSPRTLPNSRVTSFASTTTTIGPSTSTGNLIPVISAASVLRDGSTTTSSTTNSSSDAEDSKTDTLGYTS